MLIVCIIAALFCALQSVRSVSLLLASLWLGGVSVAVAIALYMVGAREIAVIELSVSAGLVMVLLVFAITVLGDSTPQLSKIRPGYLLLVSIIALGLIALYLPELQMQSADDSGQLAETLWHERSLDILLQISLLFAGALAVLRLLKQSVDEKVIHTVVVESENHADIGTDGIADAVPEIIPEFYVPEMSRKEEVL